MQLVIDGTGPLHIRATDRSNGLPTIPGMNITPRPADMMPAPFEMSAPTVVTRSFVVGD